MGWVLSLTGSLHVLTRLALDQRRPSADARTRRRAAHQAFGRQCVRLILEDDGFFSGNFRKDPCVMTARDVSAKPSWEVDVAVMFEKAPDGMTAAYSTPPSS